MVAWIFLLIQLSFATFMIYLLIAFVTGAPYVPSHIDRAKRMIALASLTNKSLIYDLGSGDGRLLFLAAKKGAMTIGVEINPYLVLYTRLRVFFSPFRKQVEVKWANLWKTDLKPADVVFVYLLPFRMKKLADKLKRELKPGSLVVTNSFIFPNWKIFRSDAINHVYVYRILPKDYIR